MIFGEGGFGMSLENEWNFLRQMKELGHSGESEQYKISRYLRMYTLRYSKQFNLFRAESRFKTRQRGWIESEVFYFLGKVIESC